MSLPDRSASRALPAPDGPGRLVFEQLRLQGFGLHRDLRADFPPGLGVWSASNERGKTTAVLGLAATIWGLPHRSDPSVPGWARYRSWHGGPHRGELTLRCADGARYTIEREFEAHRVRVRRHDDDGDALVVDAVHNPAARLGVSPYEGWLRRTLGVVDGELVLATAVLAQGDLGGDPHRLSGDVQRLLSGAGAGGARAALERLAESLRERTRSLRSLDLDLADLRQPRRLEALEAEAEALRRRAEAGRSAADRLQAAQVAVAEAEAEHAHAASEAERTRSAAQARRAWIALRAEAQQAAERLRRQRHAEERATALEAEQAAADEALSAASDGRGPPPPQAETELGTLQAALSSLIGARQREAEAVQALAAHRANDPSQRSAEAGGASGEAAAPSALRDWSPMGRPARPVLARLRRASATLLRRARAASALRERLRADEDALEQVAVFDTLSPDTLELVSGYGQRERVLVERLQVARTRRDDLLERVERHRAAFADALRLTPSQLEALETLERALERRRDPRPYRVAAAVTLGLLGGIGLPPVLLMLGWTFPGAGWLAAAVGALLGASMPFGDGTGPARARIAAVGLEGDDDELRQRLRQREAFDAQYDQVQADAESLEEAEALLAEQEAEGHAFLAAVSPVLQALPEGTDVDEAYRTWHRLKPLVNAGRTELAALLVDLVDGGESRLDPERFEGTPIGPDDGALSELARLATFQGVVDPQASPVTIGDLVVWLERVAASTWAAWEADAERHDAGRAELVQREASAQAARERHRVWGEALAAAAGRASQERLRAQRAFDEALAAVRRWSPELPAAVPTEMPALDAAAAALPSSDLLIGEDDLGEAERERASSSGVAGSGDGLSTADVARLSEATAEARAAHARLEQAERDLNAHLRSCDASDVAALRALTRELERALESTLASWRELVRSHPDLPPATLEPPSGAIGEESGRLDVLQVAFAEVERAAESAAQREREAHDALLRAQRELAASEGAEAVNVAVLLEESEERLAEARVVRDEVASLALAYGELQASVRAYSTSHRERLEARASEVLATVSARPGRRVKLDEGFAASVLERSGDTALAVQLSQGTRDQLALALRLAVLDLVAQELPLPLILDDPFAHWDEERLARARAMLRALARERQVLLLTHRSDVTGWGEPVLIAAETPG